MNYDGNLEKFKYETIPSEHVDQAYTVRRKGWCGSWYFFTGLTFLRTGVSIYWQAVQLSLSNTTITKSRWEKLQGKSLIKEKGRLYLVQQDM